MQDDNGYYFKSKEIVVQLYKILLLVQLIFTLQEKKAYGCAKKM